MRKTSILAAVLGAVALAPPAEASDEPTPIYGTPEDDRMIGWWSNQNFFARAGDDFVDARGAKDQVYGGSGDDVIFGGKGIDKLYGGSGHDYVNGGMQRTQLGWPATHKTWLSDGRGKDVLIGGERNDVITLHADRSPDTVRCGAGWDTVAYLGDLKPYDKLINCEKVMPAQ